MKEKIIVSVFLALTLCFYFAVLKKIDGVQNGLERIQTQIGSTIYVSLEDADSETDN